MRNGNNFDDIAINAINQFILKAFEVAPAQRRAHRMPCVRKFKDQLSRLCDFKQKPFTQTRFLQIQSYGCIVQFSLCCCGKAQFHACFSRAQASTMTSSKS
jgi:hypothetical protein